MGTIQEGDNGRNGAVAQRALSAGKATGMCDPQSGGLSGEFLLLPSEAQQPGATVSLKAFLVPRAASTHVMTNKTN